MLELKDVHTYYGNIHALKGISLTVDDGEIVTLIGSNGAGKSTTLRTIQGLNKPRSGSIVLDGIELHKLPAHEIATLGVAQSPEGRMIFPRMTVMENLEMGAYVRKDLTSFKDDLDHVFSLFPRLKERIGQKGGTLSGGEQQMLAMGRALMAKPKILLLDEPSMGLAPLLVELIFDIIKKLNEEGTTILLVEQNALMALSIATRGYVLQTGEIVLADEASKLMKNEDGPKDLPRRGIKQENKKYQKPVCKSGFLLKYHGPTKHSRHCHHWWGRDGSQRGLPSGTTRHEKYRPARKRKFLRAGSNRQMRRRGSLSILD